MPTREARRTVNRRSPWKIALPAPWLVYSVAPLICLLISTPAHATSIGVFNWSEYTQEQCDDVGLCGAFFFVGNFSTDPDLSLGATGDTFFNVSVGLQTDGEPMSLFLGDIASGDSRQSFDDLSGTTIATATVTLLFGLPGSIQLLDEFGNEVTALAASGSLLIDYTPSEPPTPTPEPSTLPLLIGGLSVLAQARRARRKGLAVRPAHPPAA
jgi:hypothetical protein